MKGLRDNKRVRNAASGLLFLRSWVMFFLDWWSASFIVFKERITPLELGGLSDQMNNVASWLGNLTGSGLRPWIIGLLVIHRTPPKCHSGGKFQNFPPLLSHVCLPALSFDAYIIASIQKAAGNPAAIFNVIILTTAFADILKLSIKSKRVNTLERHTQCSYNAHGIFALLAVIHNLHF